MTTPLDPPGPLAWLDDLAAPSPAPAPQASDPVPFRGVPIPHPQAPAAGDGSFHVDRARAPEAIRELEEAVRQLRELREEAWALGHVRAPTEDAVSADAASLLGAAATGGPASLVAALEAGIRRAEDLITALRSDVKEYTTSDLESVARLRRAP